MDRKFEVQLKSQSFATRGSIQKKAVAEAVDRVSAAAISACRLQDRCSSNNSD